MEDNIKMDLKEFGFDDVDWIRVAQVIDSCGHSNEPSGFRKVREFLDNPSD
jgi:hypothetical protein